jgi:hypothetical protein
MKSENYIFIQCFPTSEKAWFLVGLFFWQERHIDKDEYGALVK